jgi:flagellar hook-associated protein 3 FlgL
MRITTQMISNQAIQRMADNLDSLNKAQNRVALGKQFENASDDPVSASLGLSLRSSLTTLQNYQDTVSTVDDWMTASEFSLQQMETVANQAVNLVLRGLNDTTDAATRNNTLAPEMDELLNQAVQLANAKQNDQYIFSGFKTDQAAYTLTTPAGYIDPTTGSKYKITYQGDTNQMKRTINSSQSVTMNLTGDIFKDFLDTLAQAHQALTSNDTSTLRKSLDKLQSSLTGIDQNRTSNGGRLRQVQLTGDYLDKAKIEATNLLSKREDINLAEGVTLMQRQQTTYQAVLEVTQRAISTMNLFDLLR